MRKSEQGSTDEAKSERFGRCAAGVDSSGLARIWRRDFVDNEELAERKDMDSGRCRVGTPHEATSDLAASVRESHEGRRHRSERPRS